MKEVLIYIIILLAFLSFAGLLLHIARFPEQYISTWKYQLEQEVRAGEPEAVEYYETIYLSRGVELFEM